MAHVKKFRVWFCIAVYILAVGSAQGAVLCVGTGGHAHIRVKTIGEACCSPARTADQMSADLYSFGRSALFECSVEHCMPPTHIHLSLTTPAHLPLSAESSFPADQPSLYVFFPDTASVSSGLSEEPGASIILSTGSLALASLRSVILLI